MDDRPGMELHPPIERVPARRSLPILVAVAALGVLVVFVARPWDDHSPSPSLVAFASATPPPTSAPATASAAPTPMPTAPPPILPPPDLGFIAAPGTVSLSADPGAVTVRCSYNRAGNGTRRLVGLEVGPPVAILDERASAIDISHVAWRFQLEANVQQGVFDRDWELVRASRMQSTGTADGRPAPFAPMHMDTRPDEVADTAVYRVRVVVEWFTRNLEPAGRAEIVANRYQAARAAADAPSWPYCDGVLATG